ATVLLRGNDERGVDQAADQLERANLVAVEAARGRRIEREAAAEDGEPTQQRLLLRAEQLVAPVHRLTQRLVARRGKPPPGDEEAEPVGEPLLELRADSAGRREAGFVDDEAGARRPCA